MKRTSVGLLIALLAGLALVVFGPSTAYACSCAMGSPRGFVEGTDVIVAGTVVERQDPPKRPIMSSGDPVTFLVEADTVYKGEVLGRFEFTTAVSGASCGMEGIELDQRYVFFLSATRGGLTGGLCGGTNFVTEKQVQRILGPVATPPEPGGPVRIENEVSDLGVLALGVGAFGAAGLVLVWARRRRHRS